MKKLITGAGILLLSVFAARSQGLDSVIVERYYVSDAADSAGSLGVLPIGSTTYRIFVDMKPGYKFQALYGTQDAQGNALHKLLVTTSTNFFNNEDRGATVPDAISVTNTKKNTVMLDSWFSVGATATGEIGVLKSEDTDGSIGNTNSLLNNNDPSAGGPITGTSGKDGMITGSPKATTTVGLSSELTVLDNISQLGDTFMTQNGSVASLTGSVGPTSFNRVLVGQFTTTGTLCWELNLQIKDTVNNVIENWVAQNPTGSEMTHASLMGCDTNAAITTQVHENIAATPGFSVYPDPATASDVISMHIASAGGNASYAVYDLVGKEMFHKDLGTASQNHVEKINISSLSNGMYILKLTIDGSSSSKEIIKN